MEKVKKTALDAILDTYGDIVVECNNCGMQDVVHQIPSTCKICGGKLKVRKNEEK